MVRDAGLRPAPHHDGGRFNNFSVILRSRRRRRLEGWGSWSGIYPLIVALMRAGVSAYRDAVTHPTLPARPLPTGEGAEPVASAPHQTRSVHTVSPLPPERESGRARGEASASDQ